MENSGFDSEIYSILEDTYQKALLMNDGKYTTEQIKLMIVATNLQSLANTFLTADLDDRITMDLKQVALGILGTCDWVKEGLDENVI